MRLLGAVLISIIPIFLGVKKYVNLINRHTVLKYFLNLYQGVLDEISYSKNELSHILKSAKPEFFILKHPVHVNKEKLYEQGLTFAEITVLEEFLKGLQNGDCEYIKSMGLNQIKKVEKLKHTAENELYSKGRVYLTAFIGIGAMVFLVLI